MELTKYLVISMVFDESPEDIQHQIVVCQSMDEAKTTLNKFKELGLASLYRAGAKTEILKLEQNEISFVITSPELNRDFMMGLIKEFKIDFDDTKVLGYFLFIAKEDYDVEYIYAYLDQDNSAKLISIAFMANLEKLMKVYSIDELELIKTEMAYRIQVIDHDEFYSGFCFYISKEKENELILKGDT